MLIPDKCMKCKLNSDERFKKCKDCRHIKICEPLINKTRIAITVKNKPLVFLKDDIKFAVEFYKRYRNNDYLLYTEHRDANKIYDKYLKKHKLTHTIQRFNIWLFDYCFGDVI